MQNKTLQYRLTEIERQRKEKISPIRFEILKRWSEALSKDKYIPKYYKSNPRKQHYDNRKV